MRTLSVLSFVGPHRAALTKRFATNTTFIWFFAGVGTLEKNVPNNLFKKKKTIFLEKKKLLPSVMPYLLR
jgi:hypothetical protein